MVQVAYKVIQGNLMGGGIWAPADLVAPIPPGNKELCHKAQRNRFARVVLHASKGAYGQPSKLVISKRKAFVAFHNCIPARNPT